jgi:hypothetical protein
MCGASALADVSLRPFGTGQSPATLPRRKSFLNMASLPSATDTPAETRWSPSCARVLARTGAAHDRPSLLPADTGNSAQEHLARDGRRHDRRVAALQGTARTLDLTPYLGETGAVVVSKDIRAAMGSFSVTLGDDLAPGQLEALYGVIEPMDVIEIRMARDVSKYAGAFEKHSPIMMRGFVQDVRRQQSMTDSGPRRAVTITGGDYGLILNIVRYALYPGWTPEATLLSAFQFFTSYGIGADGSQTLAQFVETVNDKVITPFLKGMQSAGAGGSTPQTITKGPDGLEEVTVTAPSSGGSSPVVTLTTQALVRGGFLSTLGLNQWPGGTIYGCLAHFGDVGPWNELFVQAGPYLIYRPVPFKDVSGKFINAPFTGRRGEGFKRNSHSSANAHRHR